MNLITVFPDTIDKPAQCDNKETIFCSVLQRMFQFVSTKAVLNVKDFMMALNQLTQMYCRNIHAAESGWQATIAIMTHERSTPSIT